MLLAAWLGFVLQTVVGLREGESGTTRAALEAEFSTPSASGRLLHAYSGAPVAAATIEVWMEDWRHPRAPIARGTSLSDGSFRIAHPGVEHVDKLLIRAKGFRSTTVSSGDAQDLLLWPEAKHLALRVVDLEGKPIAKALAQTRQTCAHGPPAYRGESDADGRFDLAQFPPLEDEPEIVLTAPGFGALLLQEPEQMLAQAGLEIRLPRRRPVAFSLVDAQGRPLAHRMVSLGVEPHWLSDATDASGRARFDSLFYRDELQLQVEHEGQGTFVGSGLRPSHSELRLVFIPFDPAHKAPIESTTGMARVSLVDPAGSALDLPIGVLHRSGSDFESKGLLRADWGPTTVIAGGAFSGWSETVRELETPVDTTLRLVKEPVLTIELPDGAWTVHVQCGDDSVTLEGPDLPLWTPLPAGGPLIVCAVGPTQTRLVKLPRIAADATVDLRPEECVVAVRVPGEDYSELKLSVPDAKLAGHVRTPSGWLDPAGLPDSFEFKLEQGSSFEGVLRADGRVARGLGPSGEALALSMAEHPDLLRLGSLRVRGALLALRAGGADGEAVAEGDFLIYDLAPGPLLAQVQLADGRVIDLSLILKDGESRELRIEGAR